MRESGREEEKIRVREGWWSTGGGNRRSSGEGFGRAERRLRGENKSDLMG